MAYGFDINVGGDMYEQMQKMYQSMQQLAGKVEQGTQQMQRNFKETSDTIREVGMRIIEAFAVDRLFEFGKELANLTAEFEGFRNVIKYSSRDSIDAGDNLSYIEGAITRLHLPMEAAIKGFSEMQAGLIGTGIEGEKLRRLFEGISTAGTVLHLGANAQEMILYDFKEIGERGLNQRNMRSLMGWLPGISEIVKETFHKTFAELEAEHMSGPAFLDKLGGGLSKHFSPGLGNAGNSLMAQINDFNTAITKVRLQLGANLEPLFVQIMTDVKKAFDSAPVKWFITNIRSIAETVITLIKYWAEYKIGLMATNIVQEAWIAIQSAMALAAGKTEIAIEGASTSLKGFQSGLNSFGTGLLAMGIGSAIELFMKFEAHAKAAKKGFDDMMEDIGHTQAIQQGLGGEGETITGIRSAMKDTTLMKDQKYRDDLLNRAQNALQQAMQYQTETVTPAATKSAMYADSLRNMGATPADVLAQFDTQKIQAKGAERASGAVINSLKVLIGVLQLRGAKTPDYGGTGNGVAGNAFSTSRLGGASGGLGEAKLIQIHFHAPFQENIVPEKHMLEGAGNKAIQAMLRMLNNLSMSQSTTQ